MAYTANMSKQRMIISGVIALVALIAITSHSSTNKTALSSNSTKPSSNSSQDTEQTSQSTVQGSNTSVGSSTTGTSSTSSSQPTGSSSTSTTENSSNSCQPLTDGGNCYEPGEYCRDSDHGSSGIAGDGKSIACEDNDGWRWEPTS